MPKAFLVLFACLMALPVLAATYTNPERKFQFDYDDGGWEIVPELAGAAKPTQDVDKAMAERTLVTAQRKQLDDRYHARFSVVVDSLKKFPGTPAEQQLKYRKHAVDFLKSQRFHVTETRDITLPGLSGPAFEILASQRDFGLTFRQVVYLKGGDAYLLTAAARTNKYDERKPELDRFFSSFKF